MDFCRKKHKFESFDVKNRKPIEKSKTNICLFLIEFQNFRKICFFCFIEFLFSYEFGIYFVKLDTLNELLIESYMNKIWYYKVMHKNSVF